MDKKIRREAERMFVLHPGDVYMVSGKTVKRSDIMLISNEDAVKWEDFFKDLIEDKPGIFGLPIDYNFSGFFFQGEPEDYHGPPITKKENIKIAKQALRICKILEEQKVCPTCGAEKEPTVKVGDYFEKLRGKTPQYLNRWVWTGIHLMAVINPTYRERWSKQGILNYMKIGELRKLKKGEIIKIEVK